MMQRSLNYHPDSWIMFKDIKKVRQKKVSKPRESDPKPPFLPPSVMNIFVPLVPKPVQWIEPVPLPKKAKRKVGRPKVVKKSIIPPHREPLILPEHLDKVAEPILKQMEENLRKLEDVPKPIPVRIIRGGHKIKTKIIGRPKKHINYREEEDEKIDYLKSLVWEIFSLEYNKTKTPFLVKCSGCRFLYEPKEILKHIDEHRESRNFDEFMDLISKLRNKTRFKPTKPPRYRNKKIDIEKYKVD